MPVSAPLTGSSYTLTEARIDVEKVCLNRADLSDGHIDRALKAAGDEFVRVTRNTRSVHTGLSFTTAGKTLDVSAISGLTPSRFVNATLTTASGTEYPMCRIDNSELIRLRNRNVEVDTGIYYFAFSDSDTIELVNTPSETLSLTLVYTPPFTDWTMGTASPGNVTFNVRDDHMRQVARLGAGSSLSAYDDSGRYTKLRREWEAFLESCASEAAFEGSLAYRDDTYYNGRG